MYLRQFDELYTFLSIERESKMHYKVYQIRKGLVPISWRETGRYLYLILAFKIILLDVQLCFRRFFSEIRGFIVKNWLYIYDSKDCPSLATTFSHFSDSVRISRRKNCSSFEATHESIQFFTSS